jgi:hypothetical protein
MKEEIKNKIEFNLQTILHTAEDTVDLIENLKEYKNKDSKYHNELVNIYNTITTMILTSKQLFDY